MVALVVVLTVMAGCGGTEESSDRRVVTPRRLAEPARHGEHVGVVGGKETLLPAGDLRLLVDRLLIEHAIRVVETTRASVDRPGELAAATAAVESNTERLAGTIGLVYGDVGASAFDNLWAHHVALFVDYAQAVGEDRGEEAVRAEAQLGHYAADFASFTATATGQSVEAQAVQALLDGHVAQLAEQVDAYVRGDGEQAAELAHEAYAHMGTVAAELAAGIAAQSPQVFPGDPADPIVTRETLLGAQAAEYAAVLSQALREAAREADRRPALAGLPQARRGLATVLEEYAGHDVESTLEGFDAVILGLARGEEGRSAQVGAASRDLVSRLGEGPGAAAARAFLDGLRQTAAAASTGDVAATYTLEGAAIEQAYTLADALVVPPA